jgi:hypothetical protein
VVQMVEIAHRSACAVAGSVPAGQFGDSDCEELGDGLLVQPVNSLSSFAYVAVGVAIVVVARRRNSLDATSATYALLLALVGVGSVAFHGPQPDGSRVMHDVPILLTVVFIVAHDVSTVFPRGASTWTMFLPAALVAVVAGVVAPDLVVALTGLAIVAIAMLEVVISRRRLRPLTDPARRRGAMAVIATTAVAGATWILGRSGSPVCDPDGAFQFHGLWHVLSAAVFGLWWWLAIGTAHPETRRVGRDPAGT